MTTKKLTATEAAALAEEHGGQYMISPHQFQSKSTDDAKKHRIIREGHMYKVFIEGDLPPIGADNFTMFPAPDDKTAIENALGFADHSVWCPDAVESYILPFKLFCMNPEGADRFIYDYKPKEPRPHAEVYVLIIDNPNVLNTSTCFYAKDDKDAIEYAHMHVHTTSVKFEYRDRVPDDCVPSPYHLFHKGRLVRSYMPPTDMNINPQYLH